MLESFAELAQRISRWRGYLALLLFSSLGTGVFFFAGSELKRNDQVLLSLTISAWCLFAFSFALFSAHHDAARRFCQFRQ